jgi:DNA-binding transcriptional LysR family regulator
MYPGVELRLLRYVVGVAEELHFSRAAAKLHVAQPSLSKQIRELEEELGIQLFERTKREVRLTDAGKAFVQEARVALLHSQRAVHVARASRDRNRFVLGYSPYIDLDLLSRIRSLTAAQFPHIKLFLVSAFTLEQARLIHSGQLDAGLVILPLQHTDLAVHSIGREPVLAALPAAHPLCSQRGLRLRHLNDVPHIAMSQHLHPAFYEQTYGICEKEGFTPKIVQEVSTAAEALSMVAEGVGFTFARRCFERFKCSKVVFRPLEGCPLGVESAIAYRVGLQSAVLAALIGALTMKRRPQRVGDTRQRQAAG